MPKLPTDYRELQQIAKDLSIPATGTAEELADAIVEHSDDNSAIEPYTLADPDERTYKVTGAHAVLDTAPGGTFSAVIPPEQEGRLIEGGQIKPVEGDNNEPQEG